MASPEEEESEKLEIWIEQDCLFVKNYTYWPQVVKVTLTGENLKVSPDMAGPPGLETMTPVAANLKSLKEDGSFWDEDKKEFGPALIPPRPSLKPNPKAKTKFDRAVPGTIILCTLSHIDRFHAWTVDYKTQVARGDPTIEHNPNQVYLYPFSGKKKIGQGYGGHYLHQGYSQHAIDFLMAKGTTVKAARAGVVAEIVCDQRDGAKDPLFKDPGNRVAIVHDDLTFAYYTHLERKSPVLLGQRVEQGNTVGKSGATGHMCCSKPHLHFEVAKYVIPEEGENAGNVFRMKKQTLSVKFEEKASVRSGDDLTEGMKVPTRKLDQHSLTEFLPSSGTVHIDGQYKRN